MAKTTLGKAYVQILPSADGIEAKLKQAINPAATSAGAAAGKKAGNGFLDGMGGFLKSAGSTTLKAAAAGLTAAAAAVGKMVYDAVSSYAEYEQLVGGIETLFSNLEGTVSAAPQVLENAANAYKTAGLSANQYMDAVTSFSAALITSLNGDYAEAARISDQAVQDMADNANKMGSSMDSVMQAYQGFAKGQYQLLDNLKLGYGGTKTEMERLLADAQAITGVKYNIENLNDVYEAIHVIQDSMGIAGATADEAMTTITGSINMTKAAWANLITGIARGDADIGVLIDNLIESATAVGQNLLPVIQRALGGVGQLVQQLAPQISAALPGVVSAVLPPLLIACADLLQGLLDGILQALPALIPAAVDVLLGLSEFLIQNLPLLLDAALQIVMELALGIADALPELVPTIVDVVLQIADTLTEPSTLVPLVGAALEIIVALAEGIMEAMPELLAKAPEIIIQFNLAILSMIPDVLIAAGKITVAIAEGIWSMITSVWNKGVELVNHFLSAISSVAKSIFNAGIEIVKNIAAGIGSFLQNIYQKGAELVDKVRSAVSDKAAQLLQIGTNIVSGIWNGISNGYEWIKQKISGWVGNVLNWIKKQLGIASPSKVMRDQVGRFMAEGIGVGFANTMDSVRKEMSNAMPGADDLITDADINVGYHIGRPGTRQAQPAQINVYMTVNGERGQDVDALADKVIRKLGGEIGRLVYA